MRGLIPIAFGLLFLWLNISDIRRGYITAGKFTERRYYRRGDAVTFWFQILVFSIIGTYLIAIGLICFYCRW